jgi:hypothetical protein
MSKLTVTLPDDVKALAEARAAESGCADVAEYVARLIRGDAAGAPGGLIIDSDEQLQALLLGRIDGPFVEMDASDFQRMRDKLKARLDGPPGQEP